MAHIEMLGITKRFQRTTANKGVNFSVREGEIHSLLGENGAGKTTLMRVLFALTQPDEGEIHLNGKTVHFKSPQAAIDAGLAMVHQHFMLIEPLTVAENMVLGKEPRRAFRFDLNRAIADVEELSRRYHLKVDPRARIEELPVGMKQRVEILKALYRQADTLILDEPTAVLAPGEVAELFTVLRELRKDGKTVIIITHKLKETMEIADRVTILNSGRLVTTCDVAETNPQELARLMVGHSVSFDVIRQESVESRGENRGEPILELRGASYKRDGVYRLKNMNLTLHRGEILGIAGVEGNGQTELAETLCGLLPLDDGEILLNGRRVEKVSAKKMLTLGIGTIPEDRGRRGLIKNFQIQENLVLGYHYRRPFSKKGVLNLKEITHFSEQSCRDYDVRMAGVSAPAASLSGGNQQKLVVARTLAGKPKVIIAAQPTRGVDIGAIEYIHQKLIEYKEAGNAVLLISTELEEIIKLSDRVAVLYNGTLVAEDRTMNFDENRLGNLMTGLGHGEGNRS
ncbi:MAG: ABC transporter ATP-binding protein [Treponema sp.]|jgi:simple sugar transport system ATP-binding protein|nr:ABC transporter ATP-binding protein [Treponema sp.]